MSSSLSLSSSPSSPSAAAAAAAAAARIDRNVTDTVCSEPGQNQNQNQNQDQNQNQNHNQNQDQAQGHHSASATAQPQQTADSGNAAVAGAPEIAATTGQNGSALIPALTEDAAESYEREHVHSVYETIAPHFSATRYKPWPVIANFLESLAPGSVGLDVGCGNGKYLAVNPNVHIIGSDRSSNLVRIARDHGGDRKCDVAVADGLSLPFPEGRADFAICVAVLHHMSTRQRRQDGVRALLDCVLPGSGKILVYVWALEQASSRRGWDQGAAQDQMVPWVFKTKTKPTDGGSGDTTYLRYYHLYREGELDEDVVAAGGKVIDSGYDKDNWWAIASRV